MIKVLDHGWDEMRMTKTAVLLILCLMAGEADGATMEGVSFPDRYETSSETLAVRGVGLIKYMIFVKVYVAAFYLPEGIASNDALRVVPKRLEIHYFQPIEAEDFVRSTEFWIRKNVDEKTYQRLIERVERINALYEDVRPGDRYSLTYKVGRGTELALNGTHKGVIEGADFAAAMFSIWIGPHPLNESLRSALLGVP
jgi:hypothetical protein